MSLITWFKGRGRLVAMLVFSLVFVLAFSSQAFANETLFQLSSDPFHNKTSQHKAEVEPDTYSYGSTIVSAFQVGRFTDGGSSDIGWATSQDGGATWTHGFLQGITIYAGGPFDRASDPSVAYDARHKTWMISTLVFNTTAPFLNGVVTSLSKDGGLSWGKPFVVSEGTTIGYDKNWIVCDVTTASPFYGNCYTQWDSFVNNQQFNLITMSTSTDGGRTWGTPLHTANNDNGIGGQQVVQPNGTVIVPILGETLHTADIAAFRSTDGGASWSATIEVASLNQYIEKANIRNGGLPSAEIDGAGKVYVVWQDCRFEKGCSANDIVMSSSADGLKWSAVQRIPISPVGSGADYFTPGIGVDKTTRGDNARLALAYYYFSDADCSTNACQLFVGFISSINGGASWSTAEQVAGPMKLNWLAFALGYFAGDYISTSFVPDDEAYAVFAVATPPSDGHLNESMYTTPEDALKIVGGNISSAGDKVVASHPIPFTPHKVL